MKELHRHITTILQADSSRPKDLKKGSTVHIRFPKSALSAVPGQSIFRCPICGHGFAVSHKILQDLPLRKKDLQWNATYFANPAVYASFQRPWPYSNFRSKFLEHVATFWRGGAHSIFRQHKKAKNIAPHREMLWKIHASITNGHEHHDEIKFPY